MPGVKKQMASNCLSALAKVAGHPVARAEFKADALARLAAEQLQERLVKDMEYKMSNGALTLLPDYGFKLQVLKRLDFVSQDEVRTREPSLQCCQSAVHGPGFSVHNIHNNIVFHMFPPCALKHVKWIFMSAV